MTPSSVLPSNVRERVAAHLEKIERTCQLDFQAISDDLGEFGVTWMTVELGTVKLAIGSSRVSFHDETNPLESHSLV